MLASLALERRRICADVSVGGDGGSELDDFDPVDNCEARENPINRQLNGNAAHTKYEQLFLFPWNNGTNLYHSVGCASKCHERNANDTNLLLFYFASNAKRKKKKTALISFRFGLLLWTIFPFTLLLLVSTSLFYYSLGFLSAFLIVIQTINSRQPSLARRRMQRNTNSEHSQAIRNSHIHTFPHGVFVLETKRILICTRLGLFRSPRQCAISNYQA